MLNNTPQEWEWTWVRGLLWQEGLESAIIYKTRKEEINDSNRREKTEYK